MKPNRLSQSQREQAFVDAYCGDAGQVAWRAAQLAGYQGRRRVLESTGSKLLSRPAVRKLIEQRCQRVDVKPDKVLGTLELHRTADILDVFDIREDGSPSLNLNKARDAKRTGIVRKVKISRKPVITEDGSVVKGDDGKPLFEEYVDLELHDAQAAAVLLGRILGMYVERKEVKLDTGPQRMDAMVQKLQGIGMPIDHWPHVLVEYARTHGLLPPAPIPPTQPTNPPPISAQAPLAAQSPAK